MILPVKIRVSLAMMTTRANAQANVTTSRRMRQTPCTTQQTKIDEAEAERRGHEERRDGLKAKIHNLDSVEMKVHQPYVLRRDKFVDEESGPREAVASDEHCH